MWSSIYMVFIMVAVTTASIVSSQTGNVVKIGYTANLVGSEVPYGPEQYNIFKWVFNYTNHVLGGIDIGGVNYKFEQVVYNSASDCEDEQILYERLVTVDNVDILLNAATPDCEAPPMVAAQYGIPIINSGDYSYLFSSPHGNNWTFTLTPSIFTINTPCLLDMYNAGARSAILALTPILVAGFVDAVNATIQSSMPGFKILDYEVLDQTKIDGNSTYEEYLNPLIDKWQAMNADIFMGGAAVDGTYNLLLAMRKKKYNVKAQFHYSGVNVQSVRQQVGWLGNGLLTENIFGANFKYTDPVFGNTTNFATLFEQEFGFEPSTFEFVNAMAAILSYSIVQKAQSLDPNVLRQTLINYDGVLCGGPLQFNEYGFQKFYNGYCFQIDSNGQYNVINSTISPDRQAKIIYPFDVVYPNGFFPVPNYRARNLGLGIGLGVGVPLLVAGIVALLYFKRNYYVLCFGKHEAKVDSNW